MNLNLINMPYMVTLKPDHSKNPLLEYGSASAVLEPRVQGKGKLYAFDYKLIGVSHSFDYSRIKDTDIVHLKSTCDHSHLDSCVFAENAVLGALGAPKTAFK